MIRVLIADDHELIRLGLSSMLTAQPDIEVCGTAETGEAAADLAHLHRPDVVLLDLSMPGAGGIAAAIRIGRSDPQIRVLVVTCYDDDVHVRSALAAGVRGYLLKDAAETELIDAVRAVHRGELRLSPEVTRLQRASDTGRQGLRKA